MHRILHPAVLFGLALTASAQVAPTARPPALENFSGAAFTASADALLGVSARVPVNKEFAAEILYDEGRYTIAAEGTLTYTRRLIFRVDTEAAVNGWSEVSMQWDPWYEKPAQLHARVLQGNGTFIELDQKTITDAPVKADDSETFSSAHVRRAPLPGMAVGAIVEEQEVLEEKTPYFAGGELYRFGFLNNVPVLLKRLVVETPATLPYKDLVRSLPKLTVQRTESDGQRRVVYEQASVPAGHEYDIDLATNEPQMAAVDFSTGASWAAIAKGYAAMSDPQTVIAEAQTILPATLPAERLAKIQAIVKALHSNVRYTGVEFGAARLQPMRPAEVIARHYGDCKDKATLLVAMLRAAGIQANLALLSTGPGRDVEAALPGINLFDHAIVYVPADGPATRPLWIDATADTFAVGYLPYPDEGRLALVVSPETTGLTRIPEPKPEDSVLVETRTFKLAELGPYSIEERSETQGDIDANYRSQFGGPESPKMRERLETYVKNSYLAKKLTKSDHGDASDFDHPFTLTVAAEGAKRGNSSLVDAIVVIFPNATTNALPQWFSIKPPDEGTNLSDDAKRERELALEARPGSFAVRPYIYEQRTRILIPAGFVVRSLPAAKTTQLGPATLTESYLTNEPGVVEARFRFNSGVSRMTADQALAMRTAMLELNKRDYVGIFFDQAGAKELALGHIREALAIDRKLIAASPTDALHHLQMAQVLLDAGIGGEARAEAKQATELDPKLSAAFTQYGWMLEHNELGERFGKGFDLQAAAAAFQHAVELDADDTDPRFDLAILDEFNAHGERYAKDANLAGAVLVYKDLIELNKDKGEQTVQQYRENLMYALLYSRQFAELDKLNASLPSTNSHRQLAIASVTAQSGTADGIAQAEKGNVAQAERNKNLQAAGTLLANLGLYSQAAEVIAAGIQGSTDAAQAAREVEQYKSLKAVSLKPLPLTDPARPVQIGAVGLLAGTLTRDQLRAITSKHAYSSQESMDRGIDKTIASVGFLQRIAQRSESTQRSCWTSSPATWPSP